MNVLSQKLPTPSKQSNKNIRFITLMTSNLLAQRVVLCGGLSLDGTFYLEANQQSTHMMHYAE